MNQRERRVRQRLKGDFVHYAERCLRIRTKAGTLAPLSLNREQRYIHDRLQRQIAATGKVRALILKARQWGCSTYVEGRFYWRVTHRPGVRAFILTHEDEATSNLFEMAERFHAHCPPPVKPRTGAANAKELYFDGLDSGYKVGTARNKAVGRSSTIQLFHGSEVARWPNASEHAAGILQAVPNQPGTEIILESTAYGVGGLFYDMCKAAERGEGDYALLFIPWFWHAAYRADPPFAWRPPDTFQEYARLHALDPDQVRWAWIKNHELAQACGAPPDAICWMFRQEYPATAEEAFQASGHDSFIRSELVVAARRRTIAEQTRAPLILGVDVARGGADKTRLIDRQGRIAGARVNLTLDSGDTMEVAGIVARTIDRIGADKAFVDLTGVGAGVVDRLRELGYGRLATGIHFGSKPFDQAFLNKRAEMWAAMRDWFAEAGGASIPDDDDLHSHLCAPGYKFDSADRLMLEKKEDIKARLGFSTDGGDALALTFAMPVRKGAAPMPKQTDSAYSVLG